MAKKSGPHPHNRLTAAFVRAIKKPGKHADGNGLYLVVGKDRAKSWISRVTIRGVKRRPELGQGSARLVSLAEARENNYRVQKIARDGGDPREALRKERKVVPTYETAARKVHADLLPTWKNPKHADQWINTQKQYVFLKIGDRRVDRIDTPDI